MAPKVTVPTGPEAREEWRKDPRAYEVLATLHDAYDQLVEALYGRLNEAGLRLHVLRDDVRDVLAEKERDAALEAAGLKDRAVSLRCAGLKAARASSERWLDVASARWSAALGDVDALLDVRYADQEVL